MDERNEKRVGKKKTEETTGKTKKKRCSLEHKRPHLHRIGMVPEGISGRFLLNSPRFC